MVKTLEHESQDDLRAITLIRCKVNSEKKGIDWGRNIMRGAPLWWKEHLNWARGHEGAHLTWLTCGSPTRERGNQTQPVSQRAAISTGLP